MPPVLPISNPAARASVVSGRTPIARITISACAVRAAAKATIARSQANLQVIEDFVAVTPWIHFLADDPAVRSNTSVCLTLDLPEDKVKQLVKRLESEGVAYDIGAYKDAPAGIRIWCGATVEKADLQALMPWLVWAYEQVSAA